MVKDNTIIIIRRCKSYWTHKTSKFKNKYNNMGYYILLYVYIAIFMSFNIISTGIQMITPYIYADNDAGFEAAFIAYSSEIVAILVVVGLIDIPKWGGRINVTIYGLLLLAFI